MARAVGALALTAAVGLAIAVGLGKVLARPLAQPRPQAAVPDERNVAPYLTFAVMGADLEIVAPDGRRAWTAPPANAAGPRLVEAEGKVDCAGFALPGGSDRDCSASVMIPNPIFGEYRVVASSAESRAAVVTFGFGGAGFRRAGGGDVQVVIDSGRPVEFLVVVASDGVTQRTQAQPAAR